MRTPPKQLQRNIQHLRLDRSIFWVCVSLLLISAGLYIYFTASSVVEVVLRQELAQEVRATQTEISELEAQYLATTNTITLARAEELGLRELGDITYVPVTSALSLRR